MHQGSDENPFLFAIVSEAISREFSVVLPLERGFGKERTVGEFIYFWRERCNTKKTAGKFCYLGNTLSVDGDTDAAVTARVFSGWFKFRSLGSFLSPHCQRFFLVVAKETFCCEDKFIFHVYGCGIWSLKRENELILHRTEMRMIRWMCGVKIMDKLSLLN